jgi:hypothetical protein
MKVSCKGNVFIVLICYEAREVCVLPVKNLEALIVRARVTVPGRKNKRIKLTRTIPRNAFPKLMFE